MDRRFHIIITSEQGQARTFAIPKNILTKLLTLFALFITLSGVAAGCYFFAIFPSANIFTSLSHKPAPSADDFSLAPQAVGSNGQRAPQLTNAYSELSKRSRAIDSILSTLDIQPPPASSSKDSGGPFTSLSKSTYQELIFKVDRDLDTIRPLPLGYPVQATGLSSTFGARLDPLNGEEAFHEGIDLRGNPGVPVKSTADGKVFEKGYNEDYGWYVMIKHDNNFTTLYAHNQKVMVGQGDLVQRGQTIALLGNTGRSTGPHLHYEIRRHNRPVNPAKYMNISRLLSDNLG